MYRVLDRARISGDEVLNPGGRSVSGRLSRHTVEFKGFFASKFRGVRDQIVPHKAHNLIA